MFLTNKQTGLVKLVGQENSYKFRFVVSELVVGSDEQDNSCQIVGELKLKIRPNNGFSLNVILF